MTRITIFLLLAATVLVLSGLATIRGPQNMPHDVDGIGRPLADKGAAPSANAGKAASVGPGQPRLLPDSYRILLNRSVFSRDGRASARVSNGGAGARSGLWVGPPGTEATLVFRGVTLTDGSYSAYIEDVTGGGVRRFSRGEDIAAGRIAGISLNGMDYESDRKVTRIALGQNLAGGDAPPLGPPTTAPANAPGAPDGNGRGAWRGRTSGLPPGAAPRPDSGAAALAAGSGQARSSGSTSSPQAGSTSSPRAASGQPAE